MRPEVIVLRERALVLIVILVLAAAAASPLACQTPDPDRWLDGAAERGDDVRLVIFHPEVFNIRALAELRRLGILDIPSLTVIGVWHERQADDFAESRKYVAEHKLDWFKFHVIRAGISEPALFRKNACTPEFERIVAGTDGVIFFGGPDAPASIFGEKTSLFTEITDPFRHYLEASAVFHFLGGSQDPGFKPLLEGRPGFPVLGICLGFQTMNIGTGGTLAQDIRWDVYGQTTFEGTIALGPEQWHTNPYRGLFPLDRLMVYNFHSLQLGDGSVFVKTMGFKPSDHPRVLSAHHQAIGRMGKDLVATASSRDGRVIEAIEHRKFPNVLGVQFHPEHFALWDPEPRYGTKPGEPRTSLLALLESAPPSVGFNQGIWRWFAARLVESHGR